MKSAFAKKLSALRREKGLSQRRAAMDLGISQALLSHYENDAREPKLEFVAKICDYYDISADYLLGRITERKTQTLPIPHDCENAARLVSSADLVFNTLENLSNPELYSAAVDFLVIPIETAAGLLNDPNIQYEASRDAELKMAEAALVSLVRGGKADRGKRD